MCTLGAVNGRYLFKNRDLWCDSSRVEEVVCGQGNYRYRGIRGHASPLERGLNSGINEKGVAVAITFVDNVPLAEALLTKTPRGVLVEEILGSCGDLASAVTVITEYMKKPLVGGNIMVATPQGGVVLEQLYPRFVCEYFINPIVVRTNHFLNLPMEQSNQHEHNSSHDRSRRMCELLGNGDNASLTSIQGVLADHGGTHRICSHEGTLRTVSAVVYDVKAAVMHYASGPPCNTPWQRFTVN